MSEDIHTTQELANAAESFVSALGALFPGDSFEEFFHGRTLHRAYWVALQDALVQYTAPENAPFAHGLLSGQVLAEPPVVDELLRLFVPDQTPDYDIVADLWADALDMPDDMHDTLADAAETFFELLAAELRRSADLRLVLDQLVRSLYGSLPDKDAAAAVATAEQDLNRLLEAALVAGPGSLGLQVRHLIALAARPPDSDDVGELVAALTHVAGQLSADALRAVWDGLESVRDTGLRLRSLARLAPYLVRLEIVPDALALVQAALDDASADGTPSDPALRVDVLLSLAPHVDAPARDRALPSFQQRVLAGVQAIDDAASRVRALGAVIANLPPHLQAEAVSLAFDAAACCIENDVARATALSVLPPHLPPEFHLRLLSIAYELEMPDARVLLMARMIPYLPQELQSRALMAALHAVEQINGDDARAAALIGLAPYIDAVGPLVDVPDGLQQAIMVTFSIEREGDRARAFAALAPYLSPELLSEALHALKSIGDDYDRALTLTQLASHLSPDLQVAAFAIAQEIESAEARAMALAAIAPYLSAAARLQALADALVAALAVPRRYDRVVVLVDLAPHLPDDLQRRALHEALTATRSIRDESERSRALVFLAPHLLEDQLADALADAYTILDPLERVPALSALVPYLPPEPQVRVGQDVINLAHALKPPHQKASILAAIAPVLPDSLVDKAIGVAEQIDTPYDRMHVLTALLPRRPDDLHEAALAAAHDVPDRYQRVSALLELIPHTSYALRYPILDTALDTALGIADDYDRASALAHLAPYIDTQTDVQNRQQDALSLALDACLDVADSGLRAALLARLAETWVRLLSPAQSYTLWRRIALFLRKRPETDVLADLAALAPVMTLIGTPGASDEVASALFDAVFGP